jgi:hypothetical protein
MSQAHIEIDSLYEGMAVCYTHYTNTYMPYMPHMPCMPYISYMPYIPLYEGMDFNSIITRARFEDLCMVSTYRHMLCTQPYIPIHPTYTPLYTPICPYIPLYTPIYTYTPLYTPYTPYTITPPCTLIGLLPQVHGTRGEGPKNALTI